MKLRALIADDHSIVVEGLRHILEESGCELVGTAGDGRTLVAAAAKLKPEIIIIDISMPILNGIEAARQIREEDSRVKLIFLSMHVDRAYVREAFRVGGNAYLLKSNAAWELAKAIQEVTHGRSYITPHVSKETVAQLLSDPSSGTFGSELTQRQREVLQLVVEGKSGKEIAEILSISTKTVEFHKANIMDVLGLRSVAELTRYAIRNKIIQS